MLRRGPRRAALFAVALIAITLFAAPGAQAESSTSTPGSYSAKGTATALELNVFGQGITLGFTTADNASDPKSSAQGVGALLPGVGNVSDQTATATPDAPSADLPQVCGPITLPPSFPVVDLATACSSASAAVANGLPSSIANASVATVDVNANDVLGQVSGQLNPAIGQLLDGLKPVFDAVKQSGADPSTLLNAIIGAITDTGELARVSLGPSKSTTTAADATEGATAEAQGAVIEVLPRDSVALDNSQSQSDNAQADAVALDPVLTIEIGAASNSISIERATGTATVHYEPSLVKVTIAPDIASALGLTQEQSVITVTPDQEICLLPAPLESCISVAHGSQSTDENGVTHADASGVSVHLLTGVQNGITLNLAATHVEGVGALDTARVAEEPPLARTGGTVDALLGGGLFAVAIGGMMLVRRSRRHALI